jgi:homogentisate 1,2-dioxygenase
VPYYRRVGEVPRKRHSRFPRPDGGLYAEELMGEQGFSGASSLLYHRHPPTQLTAAEPVTRPDPCWRENRPLLPRHFRTHDLAPGSDPVTGRQPLLANDDVRLAYVSASTPSELYRNAVGDEVLYVEAGVVTMESTFGAIRAQSGDYLVVPRSTTHRLVPEGEVRLLVVEATGPISLPRRYLSSEGQLLEQAPYSERDLRPPADPVVVDQGETVVLVAQRHGMTRYTYAHHPFDVVGWDGCLYPFAFSIHDFEPLVKRFHAPPPVHQTFEGAGFVVCSFCPRPLDFDPEAVTVPYNHANVGSDEVLFYAGGDFMSRRSSGVGQGSISLHPAGFVHGPHPGSVESSIGQVRTEELAVMVDTFRPLQLAAAAEAVEDPQYPWSWAG